MISFNPLWRHQIDFQRYCPFVRGNHRSKWILLTKGQYLNADLWCFCCQSEKNLLNKHSIGRYFETPWRSFDVAVMYWIVSMVVAGGLTLNRCQYILNRRDEIGQLHIYRHAFFFNQNCPVVSATLRKWQRYPMQETSFLLSCDCIGVLFVISVRSLFPHGVIFLKRHRMSPVQVVTLYKPKPSCCFIKGTLYFGYA